MLSGPKLSNIALRTYATHRDNLSESLDTQRPGGRGSNPSVGPFALGGTSAFRAEKVQDWSDLSVGGKVKRATARTSNLAVILFGAGLSAVLAYVLTTELYSRNSPTVLHEEACERIRKSPKVAKYLHGPLTFYNTPTSVDRPRSRMSSHQVASDVVFDANGRPHMFLNMYIQGQLPPEDGAPHSDNYFDAASAWVGNKISGLPEMTSDGISEWAKLKAHNVSQRSRETFRYLTGAPLPPPVPTQQTQSQNATEKPSRAWQIAGVFSSMRQKVQAAAEPAKGTVFTDGEVHAELVMNNEGNYVFRYLFVDIPNTHDPRHLRVWVERIRGVPEDQQVPRFHREQQSA
ncbi:hypothetical protein CYLTODRAFT_352855 [Cylindrobasidium torrendii FP15055 ss-10]|uniref:Mitochondrial import inner membrane translocase subunit Tim21 n=1 Tax=Cylindrobasidium torrendii FP15055 ss-10 TaxID=1314674 RepID=A0A0D7BAK8_9AGAR|nr:hypothetical protein CYLTODRAFT_352855 [Cylindrobasidium torrendii FP15055 ss-10]